MVQFAEDRSCITQFELGELFQKSQEKARDYEQAFKWYQLAAINGSRQAQHRLGTLYARGQGVSQNLVKAYAWCKVAAFQNSSRGKRKLKCLESNMEFNQIREGRWLAQEYYDCYVADQKRSRAVWIKLDLFLLFNRVFCNDYIAICVCPPKTKFTPFSVIRYQIINTCIQVS